jgi:hypothetical protein
MDFLAGQQKCAACQVVVIVQGVVRHQETGSTQKWDQFRGARQMALHSAKNGARVSLQ